MITLANEIVEAGYHEIRVKINQLERGSNRRGIKHFVDNALYEHLESLIENPTYRIWLKGETLSISRRGYNYSMALIWYSKHSDEIYVITTRCKPDKSDLGKAARRYLEMPNEEYPNEKINMPF